MALREMHCHVNGQCSKGRVIIVSYLFIWPCCIQLLLMKIVQVVNEALTITLINCMAPTE